MKVLVTGSTGFLGNNLVRIMADREITPVCLLRPESSLETLNDLDVETRQGDLTDLEFLDTAMSGVDAVVHAAAMIHIGWTRQRESMDANVELTRRLANMALQKSLRFIHVSTVDALAAGMPDQPADETCLEPAKPGCAYVLSKRAAEKTILDLVRDGLDGSIVNPGFMVGPWDWKPSSGQMILAIAKQFIPLAPGGGCSAADVRDVAGGILSAIEHANIGERYILGGHNISYLELWQMMAKVVGQKGPFAKLRPPITWIAGSAGDIVAKFGREGQVNSAAVKMGQIDHYYSSEKATLQLDYQINPIEPGLQESWDWFVERGYNTRAEKKRAVS